MTTRGVLGLKCNGTYKIASFRLAASPDGLGWEAAHFAQEMNEKKGWKKLKDICTILPVVDENDAKVPGKEYYKKEFEPFATRVALMMNEKGKIESLLEGTFNGKVKKWVDGSDFVNYATFCEYGYMLDLDDGNLELFKGKSQEKPPSDNPFGNKKSKEAYDNGQRDYPITLVAKIKFDDIPKGKIPEYWVSKFFGEAEDEE